MNPPYLLLSLVPARTDAVTSAQETARNPQANGVAEWRPTRRRKD